MSILGMFNVFENRIGKKLVGPKFRMKKSDGTKFRLKKSDGLKIRMKTSDNRKSENVPQFRIKLSENKKSDEDGPSGYLNGIFA